MERITSNSRLYLDIHLVPGTWEGVCQSSRWEQYWRRQGKMETSIKCWYCASSTTLRLVCDWGMVSLVIHDHESPFFITLKCRRTLEDYNKIIMATDAAMMGKRRSSLSHSVDNFKIINNPGEQKRKRETFFIKKTVIPVPRLG